MKARTRQLMGFDGNGDDLEFIKWFDAKIVSASVEDKVIADIEARGYAALVELLTVYQLDSKQPSR
jgi:hypothetical protein